MEMVKIQRLKHGYRDYRSRNKYIQPSNLS